MTSVPRGTSVCDTTRTPVTETFVHPHAHRDQGQIGAPDSATPHAHLDEPLDHLAAVRGLLELDLGGRDLDPDAERGFGLDANPRRRGLAPGGQGERATHGQGS